MKKEQSKLFLFKKEVDDFINSPEFLSIVSSPTYSMIIPQYLKDFQTFTFSGKRIRPYFVKLGYEMCSGVYDHKILLPAVSYEIFQSGILIHDDIIDNSDLRRGMPTMHKILGESKAICMGDFGLLSSIALCAHSEFSERLIPTVYPAQTALRNESVSCTFKRKLHLLFVCGKPLSNESCTFK